MMWIWYLLLGSGSGSRTVGKFSAQADSRVDVSAPTCSSPRVGWGGTGEGLGKALSFILFFFLLFRSVV